MKKIISLLFSLAILFIGCSQDELQNCNQVLKDGRIYTASFEQSETRTYVEDGNLLRWNTEDQISLFDGNTLNCQYQFDGKTGDNSGTFSIVDTPFGSANDLTANYAIYPYASGVKITETGVITATLPAEQFYAENSFGLGANTMVAVTKDTDDSYLRFKNVCGYLKLQLYGNNVTVKSITLTGNNKELIAGKVIITPSYSGEPIVNVTEDADKFIVLNCGEGVKIGTSVETATAFWFVVPPICFEKGFSIIVEDTEGNRYSKSTDKKIEIKRNTISNMAISELNQLLEYHLFKKEIDGIDGIITQDDTYALLMHVDSLSNEVLIFGENKETYKPNYALFDQNGFLQNLFVDEESYIVSYSSDGLRVVGVTNDFDIIIPYSLLEQYCSNSKQLTRTTIRDASWIKAINIVESVCDFINNPKGSVLKWVTQNYLQGKYQRKGYIASDLIDLIISKGTSLPSWLTLLEESCNAMFWGNVWIETLPEEINKCVEVTLSCEVRNIETFSPFYGASRYLYDYELSPMELSMNTYTENDNIIQSQKRNVSNNGVEKFLFTVPKLNSKYSYMPILEYSYTCTPKYGIDYIDNTTFNNYSIFNIETFESKPISVTRKLSGKKLNFRTPSVSSKIKEISSVTNKSAEVVCTFTETPSGAICGIEYSSDKSGVQRQTTSNSVGERIVTLSSLQPDTKYTCRAYVQYAGEIYYSETSKSFTTEPEPIPDLTGTWTFNQSCLSDKSVLLSLKLSGSYKGSATYSASWGQVPISFTVYSDRSCRVSVGSYWECSGGEMNESYTYASGDKQTFYRPTGNNTVKNEPWSLSRN